MEKVIAASDACRWFGRVLNDVIARGDTFVVERHGELVAAVVPIEVYQQWKSQRAAFFASWQQVAERADLPDEEAMKAARDAVQAVRSTRRK